MICSAGRKELAVLALTMTHNPSHSLPFLPISVASLTQHDVFLARDTGFGAKNSPVRAPRAGSRSPSLGENKLVQPVGARLLGLGEREGYIAW
jgi:hypothetical protein